MEVSLDGVRVAREGRIVLEIPSLRIRDRRTTAILGPNGAGKTTLLRVIAGLEPPLAGQVRVGGVPVRPGHHVAYVFQEQVFLRRSVRRNLELGLRLRGVHRADIGWRINEAAALLGIPHLLERRATHLSGGEGRRVSIARALCLKAPLVLLDEPLAGLDERTHSRLLDELPQVLAAFAATTLIVTHSRHEALRLADDLIVIVDGRVQAVGDKRELAANPRTQDVAEVLGYVVLESGDRRVAVPPEALTPGPGPVEFWLEVDQVLDLLDGREVVGRIGEVHARVRWPLLQAAPVRGTRVLVHTTEVRSVKLEVPPSVPPQRRQRLHS